MITNSITSDFRRGFVEFRIHADGILLIFYSSNRSDILDIILIFMLYIVSQFPDMILVFFSFFFSFVFNLWFARRDTSKTYMLSEFRQKVRCCVYQTLKCLKETNCKTFTVSKTFIIIQLFMYFVSYHVVIPCEYLMNNGLFHF